MLSLTRSIAFSVLLAAPVGARTPNVDHLVPWVYGFDRDLRPLVEKKLFITPANCGRMIRMHQMTDQGGIGESVVSVYCTQSDCHATLTRAEQSMDVLWAEHRGEPKQVALVRAVPVARKDADIPRSTAYAYRECLRAALRAARKLQDDGRITLDIDRIEFWLIERGSAPLKAERPEEPGEHIQRLIDLGDQLARYCEPDAPTRSVAAKHIEEEAVRLRQVFARRNASNHAMQPTAGRRTLKFPMTQTSTPATTRALASGG